jgi:hypothetical protein
MSAQCSSSSSSSSTNVPTLILTPATPLPPAHWPRRPLNTPKRHFSDPLICDSFLAVPLARPTSDQEKRRPRANSIGLLLLGLALLSISIMSSTLLDDFVQARLRPHSPFYTSFTSLFHCYSPSTVPATDVLRRATTHALTPEAWREYLDNLGSKPGLTLDAWDY